MESEGLLAAVPQGKHCPVLCVGTLIVVSGWGAALGFEKLKAAIFDSVDVSYVQPPSPPPTTGAGASTTGIMPHAHAAACCWFPGCICRLHYVIPWLICSGCLAQLPRRLTIALLPARMLRAIHHSQRLGVVGSTGMNPPQSRRADFSRASGGLDSNPGEFLPHGNPVQEDDLIPTTWQLVCTPLLRGVPA